VKWWANLSNLGLDVDATSWEKRRARLTNRMIFIAILIVASYIHVSITLDDFAPIVQNAILIGILSSLFYFSKIGKVILNSLMTSVFWVKKPSITTK